LPFPGMAWGFPPRIMRPAPSRSGPITPRFGAAATVPVDAGRACSRKRVTVRVELRMSMNFADIHREHHVKVEIADGVALVTLDRPESRNAVNSAMHHGLELVFRELSYHPDVRAIVLTGGGNVFCAG